MPIVVLVIMMTMFKLLVEIRPTPMAKDEEKEIPFVEIVEAQKIPMRSSIRTHGTVRPRTSTTLIAEVPGIIQQVAPFAETKSSSTSFRAGGFFKKNELLLKIEDINLRTAKAEALANLRRAELHWMQEQELAKQAKIEWGERDWNLAPELVRRVPQIEKAIAETKAAEARLTQASLDLNRSNVRAPFEGRILKTMADVGQQVGAGASASLAQIYALDAGEIDLALSRSELKFLGFDDGKGNQNNSGVKAHILDDNENIIHEGTLDRSEGVVDPRTRLTKLVALIQKCFANPFSDSSPTTPLSVGQFVDLRLVGRAVQTFVIPESAFRTEDQILILEKDNRLRTRKVSVLFRTGKEVWVEDGLKDGDRVCVTPLEIVAEGMQVRISEETPESNQTTP